MAHLDGRELVVFWRHGGEGRGGGGEGGGAHVLNAIVNRPTNHASSGERRRCQRGGGGGINYLMWKHDNNSEKKWMFSILQLIDYLSTK